MRNPSRREFLAASAGTLAAGFAFAEATSDLCALTLKQASSGIRAKKFSPVDLTQACLDSIKTWNPKINAWITVMREKALAQAKILADEQAAGHFRGPLHGIPIGVKDSIDTAGAAHHGRQRGLRIPLPRRGRRGGAPPEGRGRGARSASATCTSSTRARRRRSATGARCAIPWNLERISGGPSGGSAAAVAMGNCFAALGTDSSGGIRIPAADCGVTGLKPTYGRVSLRGIVPFAWSLDHCGPMARTVEDAALVLQQIAGYDHLDIDSVDKPVPDYAVGLTAPVSQFRIGIAAQFFDHLDDEVAQRRRGRARRAEQVDQGLARGRACRRCCTRVSRRRSPRPTRMCAASTAADSNPPRRACFRRTGCFRAVDYIRGWRDLTMVRRTVDEEVFAKQNVNVLVAPVVRHLPALIEEELNPGGGGGGGGRGGGGAGTGGGGRGAGGGGGGRSAVVLDNEDNTRPFNGYGLPVISIPCGFSKDGLPIGLQIAGPLFAESNVLALAHAYPAARPTGTSEGRLTAGRQGADVVQDRVRADRRLAARNQDAEPRRPYLSGPSGRHPRIYARARSPRWNSPRPASTAFATFNPKIDAWITVMREQALAQAKALDKEQAAGHWRGPLHGIPIGLKDNIDAAGVRTTAGSKTLAGNIATADAEVTRRLRAAGAVFVGKCNMHIFAAGATSAVSYFGPVRNPWNLEMISGGSSGGSAAAVAMDHCYAALGTDTGGSIRTPSAMCGVTGFKATYGRVSIRGIVPLTWSLDHCGPIARTVEDTALVLQVIAGYDHLDLQSVDYPVPITSPPSARRWRNSAWASRRSSTMAWSPTSRRRWRPRPRCS